MGSYKIFEENLAAINNKYNESSLTDIVENNPVSIKTVINYSFLIKQQKKSIKQAKKYAKTAFKHLEDPEKYHLNLIELIY